MKWNRIAAAALLITATSAAAAPPQFEGEADFKITTRRQKGGTMNGTARMFVAPAGFRMEWVMETGAVRPGAPPEIKMTMLAKLPNPEKVYLVNDDKKTYSSWDAKAGRDGAAKESGETYTVETLGPDRIAGYACQNARVRSSKGTDFDVCVTKELGASTEWIAAMNRNDPEALSWLKALREKGIEGFPIRWSVRQKGSSEPTMVMELVSAQKKNLPASLFSVPAGYTETDFAVGGLTPEQEKAMGEALKKMSPEQRRQYEEMMKRHGQPTPAP